MRCNRLQFFLTCTTAVILAPIAVAQVVVAQDSASLVEKFDSSDPYRVDLQTSLTGRLAVPQEKGKPPQVLDFVGRSSLVYDEKVLPTDENRNARAIRVYRQIDFSRRIGDREQKAEVRAAVRRMVVLRSEKGKKVPFSPDGALTWNEIDVVRADIFSLALVPGLLPAKPVRPGDKWAASSIAVIELTDYDTIEDNKLTVEFVAIVPVDGRKHAKLTLAGTIKGATEDGPSSQKIDGIAYFDLDANRLTYLKIAGTNTLLGPDGRTTGEINGTFIMKRSKALQTTGLSADELRGLELRPNDANTMLLYDNAELGVSFNYPRRWRVGVVEGRRITIDEANADGHILITLEPTASVPTAEQYVTETKAYIQKQNWTLLGTDAPRRISQKPTQLDRFGHDIDAKGQKLRLEYAVLTTDNGGATIAARMADDQKTELLPNLEQILKSLQITKRIEK